MFCFAKPSNDTILRQRRVAGQSAPGGTDAVRQSKQPPSADWEEPQRVTIRTMNGEDDRGSAETPTPSQVVGSISAFDPFPSVQAAITVLSAAGAPFALIGGLALEAWGIPRATKDADFAVLVGSAEIAAAKLRSENVETHPRRIGGVAVRDEKRNLRIDFIDRRVHLADLFRKAIEEASASHRVTKLLSLRRRLSHSSFCSR
jgi:hypothetical protein